MSSISFCPFCGGKIEAVDAVFCPHCGSSLEGAAPVETKEYIEAPPKAVFAPPGVQFASITNRFLALLLDTIVLIFVYVFIFFALWDTDEEEVGFVFYWIVSLIGVFYWFLLEGLNDGQTIGKIAVGIRVVKIDKTTGEISRCTLGASVVRNILRIIDNLPFLYIIGLISISSSDYEQRVGDRVADTIVIKT